MGNPPPKLTQGDTAVVGKQIQASRRSDEHLLVIGGNDIATRSEIFVQIEDAGLRRDGVNRSAEKAARIFDLKRESFAGANKGINWGAFAP